MAQRMILEEATPLTPERIEAIRRWQPPIGVHVLMTCPYPRVEFEMSSNDLDDLLEAAGHQTVGRYAFHPGTPQQRTDAAWARLGQRMRFDPKTVRPARGKNARFFTAVPTESPEDREKREAAEQREVIETEIQNHRGRILGSKRRIRQLKEQLAGLPA